MSDLTSDLVFIKNAQVDLVASSTMVRKYLYPSWVGTKYGPQTSTWIKSKGLKQILLLNGKDRIFCFAKGQTVHTSLQFAEKEEITSFKVITSWKKGVLT